MRRAWPLVLSALLLTSAVRADELKLISPDEIDYRELELEQEGSASLDPSSRKDGGRFYSFDAGTGVTPWWHVGVELDVEREAGPGNGTEIQGGTLENLIRLTRPGENWADAAVYSEVSRSQLRDTPNDALIGALILKDVGRTTHTLNLFLDKEFGGEPGENGVRFSYAWQSRWNLYRQFAPAIESFGQSGQIIAGPVATGTFLLGPLGKLRYEAGYLPGLTAGSPAGTVRWRLEMEIPL